MSAAHLEPRRLCADDLETAEEEHLAGCIKCRAERRVGMRNFAADEPLKVEITYLIDISGRSSLLADALPSGILPERYEDLGRLGAGGMAEVRRVRDRQLGRIAAMKLISSELMVFPTSVARFSEEAQIAAQLQHPNLVPVYDSGRLSDGRAWFTMKEVRGRKLTEVIRRVHAASADKTWRPAESGWTFHRLVDAFATVCDAVGYAHARGVLHRDLKPDNVMVGDHGEILVLDWGLAKILGRNSQEQPAEGVALDRQRDLTQIGTVSGTVAYMAPEQARGEVDKLDRRTDVYGLGAILYEILSGRAPYRGVSVEDVLAQVLTGPPEHPGAAPAELLALWSRTMARKPEERLADGAAVASEVRVWLEDARRREEALAVVEQSASTHAEAAELQRQAAAAQAEAEGLLDGVKSWEPEERKLAGWMKADEAKALQQKAGLALLRAESLLQSALQRDPDLPEAHAALVERYRDAQVAAEARCDADEALRAETRLREHLALLPQNHPVRVACTTWLKGNAELSLVTDPPGAEVELLRYVVHYRRSIAVPERHLGRTPLTVTLPVGSYLCVLRYPGRADVRYPVLLGRGEHWDGVPPGGSAPEPVLLPLLEALGPEDRLVAGGWFLSGGPMTNDPSPWQRIWCDTFAMRQFPVTNREYLLFLDDLVRQGREEEALRLAPRESGGTPGQEGPLLYRRKDDGTFALPPNAETAWTAEHPVVMIHFGCAVAYARWLSEQTGLPWRIPVEFEWEKSARGVDGRPWPWGDQFDSSRCNIRDSLPGPARLMPVDTFPYDVSVYGVRGMGGNALDWCADLYHPDGAELDCGRVIVRAVTEPVDLSASARRPRRGGVFIGIADYSRCANRSGHEPSYRHGYLGFRLARAL